MVADCCLTDEQSFRNHRILETFSYQADDLTLTGGQRRDFIRLDVLVPTSTRYSRQYLCRVSTIEPGFASVHLSYGFHEDFGAFVFQHQTYRPELDQNG